MIVPFSRPFFSGFSAEEGKKKKVYGKKLTPGNAKMIDSVFSAVLFGAQMMQINVEKIQGRLIV